MHLLNMSATMSHVEERLNHGSVVRMGVMNRSQDMYEDPCEEGFVFKSNL